MVDEIRKLPYSTRKEDSRKLINRHPGRVPIIIAPYKDSTLPSPKEHKFLVPLDMTLVQFMEVIRRRINLNQTQAIFMFADSISEKKRISTLIPSGETFANIYEQHKDMDGFLYLVYSEDAVFG